MKDLVVFVIYDKVTGQYSMPQLQTNKEMAIRHFDRLTQNPQNLSETTDYQMYITGSYSQETGQVTTLEKLEFIKNATPKPVEVPNE